MKKINVGFIGLGNMGGPMARNIMKSGYPLSVLDIKKELTSPFEKEGVDVSESPQAVGEKSDIVLTSLPTQEASEEVWLGKKGVLAGYPTIDMRATVYDGSYHTVDSSEMAFKVAGSLAFKKGAAQADPVLLEPIMDIEVVVPKEYMGDIIGDLNSKRGKIMGMEESSTGKQSIKAKIPQAEIFKYAIDLRSITQGRGTFSVKFSHYEEVPPHISQEIVAHAKREEEEE